MHSSQDGASANYLGVALSGSPPNDYLLNALCAGCHAPTDGSVNSHSDGASAGVGSGTPFINDSTTSLAGGYFVSGALSAAQSAKQHNVSDLSNGDDQTLGPSGADVIPGSGNTYTISTCESCHSILGHHENEGGTVTGTNVATSFRFLSGVLGTEDTDWQYSTSTGNALNDHNFYYGEAVNFAAASVATTGTIDSKCAECHGYFHSRNADSTGIKGTGGTASWTRHPTDIAYPATGEYAVYAPATTYNTRVPVGWTDYTPAPANPTVICLSCHYAHGGPNNDMLRWSYASWPGNGESNGCFTCHSYKQ